MRMQSRFSDLIEQVNAARSHDAFASAATAFANSIGVQSIAYLAIPSRPRDEPYLLSNYSSAWTLPYMQRRWYRLDPVIGRADRDPRFFPWGSPTRDMVRSKRHEDLFDGAASHGIRCGVTFPIHDPFGRKAAVTFASDERNGSLNRIVRRNQAGIQAFVTLLHIHVRARLLAPVGRGDVLSQREYACLSLAAGGMTVKEIARDQNIRPSTARAHLDAAATKIGAVNRGNALALFGKIYMREDPPQ